MTQNKCTTCGAINNPSCGTVGCPDDVDKVTQADKDLAAYIDMECQGAFAGDFDQKRCAEMIAHFRGKATADLQKQVDELVEMLDGVLFKLTCEEGLDDFMIKEAQSLLNKHKENKDG